MHEAGALVIGGDYRGLGIVRSLGRRGIPVWVATRDDRLAAYSRYATRALPWPEGSDDDEAAYLLRLAEEHGLDGWVLFPTSDASAELVSRNHSKLSRHFRLTTSPREQYEIAQDKRLVHDRAAALGIDVPETRSPVSLEEVAALDLEYPVILKPASGVIDNPITADKVWRVEDRAELLERFAEASAFLPAGQLMIQEIIPGGGEHQVAFAAACRDGEVFAFVTARRHRQIPMDFGRASTFVETIDFPEIIEPATRIIADIGLTGLVEVEFKHDPRNDKLKILDVNARVWGWHSIGAAAGVDFPFLAWQLARGETVAHAQGRAGVRWVRLSTDLATSWREIVRGRMGVGAYVRSLRPPLEGPLAARDDPRPGLMEMPLLGRRFARRLRARLHVKK